MGLHSKRKDNKARGKSQLRAAITKALRESRLEEAESLSTQYIQQHPKDYWGYWRLGQSLMKAERYAVAGARFGQAANLAPGNVDVLYALATSYRRQKRYELAIDWYGRALRLDPTHHECLLGMSIALRLNGHPEAGKEVAERAVLLRPFVVRSEADAESPSIAIIKVLANLVFRERKAGYAVQGGHNTADGLISSDRFTRVNIYADAFSPGATWLSELPRLDLAFVIMADADAIDARGWNQAAALLDFLKLPTINEIPAVRSTTRNGVYERVYDIPGIVMPRTLRRTASNASELLDAIEEADLKFPLITRPTGTQTGAGMTLFQTRMEFLAAGDQIAPGEYYIAEFHNFRSEDGLWRKTRIFCIGNTIIPEHHVAAEDWNIHAGNARILMKQAQFIDDEVDFIANFEERIGMPRLQALRTLHKRLGLDYLGVDCSLLADGRILVFEANAGMQFQSASQRERPFLMKNRERISAAFTQMIIDKLDVGKAVPRPEGRGTVFVNAG
jgi:tetratricopeptide (TPR) repeat protein